MPRWLRRITVSKGCLNDPTVTQSVIRSKGRRVIRRPSSHQRTSILVMTAAIGWWIQYSNRVRPVTR